MDPQVVAAIIAASVSVLTLIGTLAAQYFGRRATSRDTEKTLEEQGKHLDRTLAEQRENLDRTLAEQHEQLDRTLAEQRTRTLNERFATAAEQLGNDQPAIRLAGVYAMAGLADDWEENRQTCVDVLCAYLRIPYEPDPGQDINEPQQLAFQAIREVRHTVIRVITAHLREDAAVSWQGLNFDFTGAVFDGAYFNDAKFSGGTVYFGDTEFSGDTVYFRRAKFSGGTVDFGDAQFSGGTVDFSDASDWLYPPAFPWTGTPPPGVKLPRKVDPSEA
jgi:Pentapeptide repeats (9 copies)